MADLTLRPDLIARLQQLAQRENRPVDAVVESMLASYSGGDVHGDDSQSVDDKEARFQAQYREFRRKLYRIAREYWASVGNSERLVLTDEQLDAQFWLIDPDGVPRLKSEQGTIELPSDPLEAILGIYDDDVTDMSTTVRETMDAYYREKYAKPD